MKKQVCKSGLALLTASALLAGSLCLSAPAFAAGAAPQAFLQKIAGLSIGKPNADGGVAEIVKYNSDNQALYVVSGATKSLRIVPAAGLSQAKPALGSEKNIDVAGLLQGQDKDFVFGDLTSVAISRTLGVVAVAVQHKDYDKPGRVLLLSYDGDFVASYAVGVQPDMLTFTADGKTLLTANEGEPRQGYGAGVSDPAGSVSILKFDADPAAATVATAGFQAFDTHRAALIQQGVMLKKGAAPSVDLEPEYIAVNADGSKAYATLQEANAIATVDIASAKIEKISPLGYKDYSKGAQKLDLFKKDTGVDISHQAYYGAYMPDGIAFFAQNGKNYLLTANEGDAREWGDEEQGTAYINEKELKKQGKEKDSKVVTIDADTVEGLPQDKPVLFGGRSFSVWDADKMQLVYDSAADFETITNRELPDFFNCSNDSVEKKDRSGKKGPEPEEVQVGTVDGKPYAFIALERIGGIMGYDLSRIQSPQFVAYSNTRDFSQDIAGDVAPEGLCFIPADESPNSYPLLAAANEVSGTLSVQQFRDGYEPTLHILHSNDMHGSVTSSASSIGADRLKTMKASLPHALLLDAGDATQGGALASLSKGKDVITLMNAAGYDAMAAGNHEFDYGLAQFKANAAAASFPILSANTLYSGQPVLQGAKYDNGRKTNADGGSVLLEPLPGVQVGVFGLTTPETAAKTNPDGIQGVSFADVTATAKTQIAKLKQKGADLVICLAHLGVDPSTKETEQSVGLAKALGKNSGLDLILDGHSHSVYPAKEVNGIVIEQTGSSSKNVGSVKVSILKDGSKRISGRLLASDEVAQKYAQDPAVAAQAQALADANAEKLKPVVGKTDTTLWGGTINGFNEARIGETNLGSLIADAMVASAKKLIHAPQYKGLPVVALQNGGGVRATIQRGSITVGSSLDVLPFGNTLAFKAVTPKILYTALENGVSKVVKQDATTGQITGAGGCFPQISGMRFTYNPDKPVGQRVQAVYLDGSSAPLDRSDGKSQLVLVSNDFEIAGGDGYTMLSGLPSIGEGGVLEEAVRSYYTELTAKSSDGGFNLPLSTGRIQTVGAYQPKAYAASVQVHKGDSPLANAKVQYRVDGGLLREGATDAKGLLKLQDLPDGPHSVRVGDSADVLVNNYSGAGMEGGRAVTAALNQAQITDVSLQKIQVQAPAKTSYQQGEALDLAGLSVTAVMSDGGTQDVTAQAQVSGYDKNKVGSQTITVSYAGMRASFTVTVLGVAPLPSSQPEAPSSRPQPDTSSGASSSQSAASVLPSVSPSQPSTPAGPNVPATGDTSAPVLAGFVGVAAAGLALLLLKRRRK